MIIKKLEMRSLKINVIVKRHISHHILIGKTSLVNLKSAKSSNIKLVDKNKNLISDPKKISNTFNDHFASIGSKIEQKINLVILKII